MIATIIIVVLALIWLLYETDFMRVRLETYEYQKPDTANSMVNLDKQDIPYYWKSPEDKEQYLIICHNHWNCPYSRQCKKVERWTGWKLPAITINVFNCNLNLAEGCNIKRALFLKSLFRELKHKPTIYNPPQFKHEFIQQVRIGSHNEYVRWNHDTQEFEYSSKYKKGFHHRVVEDYTTKYHDCLPGKEWLKTHENDDYPEPEIEITVDGKIVSFNGNYQPKLIKDFMGEYTYKQRNGRKTIIAMKG